MNKPRFTFNTIVHSPNIGKASARISAYILFSLCDFPVIFFAHHLIPGYAWFFGVCVDCDVGERSVKAATVPVGCVRGTESHISNMKFFHLDSLYLVITCSVRHDKNLSALVAVPCVVNAFRKDHIMHSR